MLSMREPAGIAGIVPRVSICAYVQYATPRFFPRPPVCRFSPTSCSPFYHLYLDVLRVRPAVLWPAVLSRFRGDAPRYCRHSICPARSALYVYIGRFHHHPMRLGIPRHRGQNQPFLQAAALLKVAEKHKLIIWMALSAACAAACLVQVPCAECIPPAAHDMRSAQPWARHAQSSRPGGVAHTYSYRRGEGRAAGRQVILTHRLAALK